MDRIINWHKMNIGQQIYNIGSEVSRAIKFKNKGNWDSMMNFIIKSLELLDLTKLDPKNAHRKSELNFMELELLDYFVGQNSYNNNDETILKCYDQYISFL